MANIELDSSIQIDLLSISAKTQKKTLVTTNRVTKFFGELFGKKWGQEEHIEKYSELSLHQLKKILEEISVK